MKLAAIYNVFDGLELLKGSIDCIKGYTDEIIIVYQKISNFGEQYDVQSYLMDNIYPLFLFDSQYRITLVEFTPTNISGQPNEILKRQLGIDKAKELGCTHFIQIDCDEYFKDFGAAKKLYFDSGYEGSVCKMWTYFKRPTLRLENPESYYVPFIHKLNANTVTGVREYPYYCDKTRQINIKNVIELPIFMHHFSWVRYDIELKLRNSSAKRNRNIDEWASDYYNSEVKEGFYLKDFQQKLVKVDNIFNITISQDID